jgi:Tfp pilus assembly protein PilO
MKITPMQQYIFLGVALFLGIVFLYYQFLLKPINTKIVTLQATLDQKKKDLEEAKRIAEKFVEFKKRADSVQRELEWIQNRIPKTIEKAKLLEEINYVQGRSGVILTNFTFAAAPISTDICTEIPTSITFKSDFKGLINFLFQVSKSDLFMTVHDIAITSAPLDPNNPKITLNAQMTLSGIQAK